MKARNSLFGATLALLSACSFCIMSILVKWVPEVSSFKITFIRFLFGLIVIGFVAWRGLLLLRFHNKWLLFSRGLFHGMGVYLFYLSITKLGLAKGSVIANASPIFAALLSALLLKERVPRSQWVAIGAALSGLYLIMAGKGVSLSFGWFEFLALGGAFLSGLSSVAIKQLHATDSTYSIFFIQCAVGVILCGIPAANNPCSFNVTEISILAGIGATAMVGQLLMTQAYYYTTASVGSLLGLMLPVFNVLIGIAFFGEYLGVKGTVGATAIIASCAFVIIRKTLTERSRSVENIEPELPVLPRH